MLHDNQIRELLFDYLEDKYGKIRIFEEKNISKSRADVIAILDSAIIGLEIKSDFDTYTRLASQVESYDKFCDFNYVVVGRTHKLGVVNHIPSYWGILAVDESEVDPIVYLEREALPNPKMKLKNQVSMLWKSEMHNILLNVKKRKYVGKSRKFLIDSIMSITNIKKVKQLITDEIFERDYSVFERQVDD